MVRSGGRFIALLLVMSMASLADAAPLPVQAASGSELLAEQLGRRNPFRPLILGPRSPLPLDDKREGGNPAPRIPVEAPQTVLDRLEYVGIVYDEAEAIAAVSDGARTWFVRKGDRLEGAAVASITPNKLTWKRKGALIVKHLRREGVY